MPELLDKLEESGLSPRAVLAALAALLLALILVILAFRHLKGGAGPEEVPGQEPEAEAPVLVTRQQIDALTYDDSTLGTVRWTLSREQLEELNRVLHEYGITTAEDISQFLAQAAVESLGGSALTEWGDEAYFQDRGYTAGTRGAGYLHLTFGYGQMAFSTWLMKKYMPELADITYANPANHGREDISAAYYAALQTAANMGLDVSRYSRVVHDRRDPAETGYTTGADYIAEAFAWESAAYFWHISGVSGAFLNFPTSLNTDIASDIVGGSNWQSRREAYTAYYPVFAAEEKAAA